jgi:hypothetical protein
MRRGKNFWDGIASHNKGRIFENTFSHDAAPEKDRAAGNASADPPIGGNIGSG